MMMKAREVMMDGSALVSGLRLVPQFSLFVQQYITIFFPTNFQ